MSNNLLQMSFVPTFSDDHKFFVWMTDPKGKPRVRKNKLLADHLRFEAGWSDYFAHFDAESKAIDLLYQDEVTSTHGLRLSMRGMFLLFFNPLLNSSGQSTRHSDSFRFFKNMAEGIRVCLEHGHYLPYLIRTHNGEADRFIPHWILNRKLLKTSGLSDAWLREIPPEALSLNRLQTLKLQHWLHLLLDMWADILVRHSQFPIENKTLDSFESEDYAALWLSGLQADKPKILQETQGPEKQNNVHNSSLIRLKTDIDTWLKREHKTPDQAAVTALSSLFQHTFEERVEPETVVLRLTPSDRNDPFQAENFWSYEVVVKGERNGKNGTFTYDEVKDQATVVTFIDDRLNHIREYTSWSYASYIGFPKPSGELHVRDVMVLNEYTEGLQEHLIELEYPHWLKWSHHKEDIDLEMDIEQDASFFDLTTLVNYNWQVAVGGETVSPDTFKELVKQGRNVVLINGRWVNLSFEEMFDTYSKITDVDSNTNKGQARVLDVLKLKAANAEAKQPVELSLPENLKNYLGNLSKKPTRSRRKPKNFVGSLRPYQKNGFTWLAHLRDMGAGGCLADDMGLGKTIQTIAYLCAIQNKAKGDSASLIVCPTSIMGNWENEIQTFAPHLKVYIHHGQNRRESHDLTAAARENDIILTTYTLMTKEAQGFAEPMWRSVILDEAQAIKNPQAKKARAARGLHAEHRIALTGTPMENRLEELWSIMEFLNPGYLGNYAAFRREFITPIEKKNNHNKKRTLSRLIQPFLLRREKTDKRIISDLPEKQILKDYCHLTPVQASVYQNVVDRLMTNITTSQGMQRKGLILSALTRLKQVCNHPYLITEENRHVEASGKLLRLLEIITKPLANNEKCLIFTQYVGMGNLLSEFLAKAHEHAVVRFLHGGLNPQQRQKIIDEFRAGEQGGIMILSLRAGGLGLNLTEANHVIHYDRWWNPAVEDQATDRAYRIGQRADVNVHKLICRGTMEERIDELIEKKKSLTQDILGQSDSWVTELDDNDLYDIVKLRERSFTG